MGICIMIKTITGFLQRLLFINRKVLLAVKDESMIYTYGLSQKERIALAVIIICEIFNQDIKRINLSEKAKVDMIVMIIKEICKHTNTNINITINNKKDL